MGRVRRIAQTGETSLTGIESAPILAPPDGSAGRKTDPMTVAGGIVDSEFDAAKELVETTIRKFGIDPALTRAPSKSDSQAAWTLKRGSASVLVTVTYQESEDVTYLRVVSPVVTLPSDAANQAALVRRVLELNAGGLANAAFGLLGDRIVAVSERPASGMGAEEVEQIVRHLAAVADTFDDRFEKEFGATKA